MDRTIPKTMKAAVIDKYGGPNVLHVATLPVPDVGGREILIRVHAAGVSSWDPWMREGGMGGGKFPRVLGSDGSGTVVAAGANVKRFKPGDKVYAYTFENDKGGFYAEFAAIPEEAAALVPAGISMDEAAGLAACGLTAVAGLDVLTIKSGTALLVTGASGCVGHIALQLAKRQGARVLAVASGRDGAELAARLGADRAVNGKAVNVAGAARAFAPDGLDGAFVFAHAARLEEALRTIKKGGTIAYPEGVDPEPKAAPGVKVRTFNGTSSPEAFARLNKLVASGPFRVAVPKTYRFEDLPQAHRDILKHHLGKFLAKPRG